MKKVLLASALVLVSTSAFALISGTPHDFKSTGSSANKGTSDQTCKYCHVPHNSTTAALLWSRTAGTAATTFYANGTMDATTAVPTAPQSTLCLSCHNAAPGAAGAAGVDFGGTIAATKLINSGTGLVNDHPIGFVYNAALVTADGGLTTVTTGTKDTVNSLPLFGTSGSATLECASCHAVHGQGSVAGGTYIPMFLRTTNAGSALCLKCHVK